jgi:hypothetical protein
MEKQGQDKKIEAWKIMQSLWTDLKNI